MPVDTTAVKERWGKIRANPACDLALTPESVAEYLRKPEHELVQDRIRETLYQLARYRLETGSFRSEEPKAPGDLATCEGLEAFLVPAVQGSLSLKQVLAGFRDDEQSKTAFLLALRTDIDVLLEHWTKEKGHFSGQPYAKEVELVKLIPPNLGVKKINVTEAAAMACRVLIHLLTLTCAPHGEGSEMFEDLLGKYLDEERMFRSLSNAIQFLVTAFQKGNGQTEEERIANATFLRRPTSGRQPGSGWSWTDWEGMPPMLFFTAAAVDAFAELDLYLIRPATAANGNWANGSKGQQQLVAFYRENKTALDNYQLCVEMSRKWVQSSVLPVLSLGSGLYQEEGVEYKSSESIQSRSSELTSQDLDYSPVLFYNNLYGLQILLWSWADWNETGDAPQEDIKNSINRALTQLVSSYDGKQVVRDILKASPYEFYLPPGTEYLKNGKKEAKEARLYFDFGFLPLLTRLLVLFVVYGVGDRNQLEPVIRDLYIRLLQSRNRTNADLSALWSENKIEVFSTQRAMQALTFYYAYARGKELVNAGAGSAIAQKLSGDAILLLNKTGRPLILEAKGEEQPALNVVPEPVPATPERRLPPFSAKTFGSYLQQLGLTVDPTNQVDEGDFIYAATDLGNTIIGDLIAGRYDELAAVLILDALARVAAESSKTKTPRYSELELFKQQYEHLRKMSSDL